MSKFNLKILKTFILQLWIYFRFRHWCWFKRSLLYCIAKQIKF